MMNEEDPDDMSIQVTAFDDEETIEDPTLSVEEKERAASFHVPAAIVQPPLPSSYTAGTRKEDDVVHQFREQMLKLPREARNLFAGGMAGMLAKTIVAPFDRIKILYQVSSAEFHIHKVPQIAWRIFQEEGFAALWKGNMATLIRVFPYSGIQFMVFDRCKTFLLREQELEYVRQTEAARRFQQLPPPKPKWGLTPLESLVAGMAAGATSVVATYPLDLTRAQLAVSRTKKGADATGRHNMGFVGTLLENYRNRGAVGLFRGVTPTLMGILPYSGLAFAFNEQGKRKIQNVTGRDLTTIERMQCGALSGLLAQTLTYPLEVTRRRMQTIGIVATCGKDAAVDLVGAGHSLNPTAETAIRTIVPNKPPTMGAIVRELYQEQGIRGFFKGVSLNWFKGPIAFSISFTTFDTLQNFLQTEAERTQRLPRQRPTATA